MDYVSEASLKPYAFKRKIPGIILISEESEGRTFVISFDDEINDVLKPVPGVSGVNPNINNNNNNNFMVVHHHVQNVAELYVSLYHVF